MTVNFSDLGYLRVGAFSPEVAIGDPDANAQAILDLANPLVASGLSIALFPELCVSGYSAEDLFFAETRRRPRARSIVCARNPRSRSLSSALRGACPTGDCSTVVWQSAAGAF